jgi:hypothetical protein
MARTDFTVKQVSAITPITDLFASATALDAVNGMQFTYTGGKRKLIVNNGSGSSINVTIPTPSTADVDGLNVPDRVVAVAAGKIAVIKEFASAVQADGKIYVDFSSVTTVTGVVLEDA